MNFHLHSVHMTSTDARPRAVRRILSVLYVSARTMRQTRTVCRRTLTTSPTPRRWRSPAWRSPRSASAGPRPRGPATSRGLAPGLDLVPGPASSTSAPYTPSAASAGLTTPTPPPITVLPTKNYPKSLSHQKNPSAS